HIHSIATIDQGIEVLTGIKAGDRLPDGTFEPGSVNARVEARLKGFAEASRSFARSGEDQAGNGGADTP
ncbi:MAG: hypothetical protein AAGC70_19990, partial [Pseudomonadota bacterium]